MNQEAKPPHLLHATEGEMADLGVAKMRLLAQADSSTEGFSMAEFTGIAGPWTVPHVHNSTEEAFFVLSGRFRFTVGGEDIEIAPGGFLNVPSGTPHVFSAHPGGGSLLVLWVPGGLEAMFLELARLPSGSIRDPKIRAEISARYDSVPMQP
jgi:quercetin dioxygenase-like cupin family protein